LRQNLRRRDLLVVADVAYSLAIHDIHGTKEESMGIAGALGSLVLIFLILMDGFEAMVLPRRVTHRFRYARLFYTSAWAVWRALALRIPPGKLREAVLSRFGPLSLLGLFTSWVVGLIVAFALLNWFLETGLKAPEGESTFATRLYLSGVTFFTLGYGEVTPVTPLGRLLAVLEAGIGFAFMAVIIGYLPTLFQAFSQRETAITLLDARAGSPPSSSQLLLRLAHAKNIAAVDPFLAEWERWSAELLESHLSFPVLGFYRSQHDNQSWLSALTTVLDACALLIVGVKGKDAYQAELTFAMARHAVVDLSLVLKVVPRTPAVDRLTDSQLERFRNQLREAGLELRDGPAVAARLAELRGMYEPFVHALAQHFLFTLPEMVLEQPIADNWQRSAWMKRTPGIGNLTLAERGDGWHD
jgi:voltage-gated potassium channel Kch